MADQRIFFEQGSLDTGDSGERGDGTSPGQGVASVKPIDDGERAAQSILNRPTENMRKRTEALRVAGEEAKYLLDSNMKWIISAGNADGLSPGPLTMPGISAWDPVGGTFTTSAAVVVQPINTPGSDKQETATYSFTDTSAQTASVAFTPISDADPASSSVKQKRAYNGANLIKVVWEAVPLADLATATVANYCNVALSGDPEHILTISIRDDDLTIMSHLATALATIETAAGQLGDIGLGYVIAGTTTTELEIADVVSGPQGLDYRMKGTFEREIHYIPASSFSDFFATPNSLADGDTLSIYFADYATDAAAADPLTGRRESVPSNITATYPSATTVAGVDMFITSDSDDVYKIPLAIPLCKRIGDDLYWMDGTVVTGTQALLPVYFGENGTTVDRSNIPALDTNVTGSWLFNDIISIGATRAVTTTHDYAIYARRYTAAAIAGDLFGIHLDTQASHTIAGSLTGIYNWVANYAAVTSGMMGINTTVRVTDDPGAYVIGTLSTLNLEDTNGQTPTNAYSASFNVSTEGATTATKATNAGGVLSAATLHGGEFTNYTGFEFSVPVTSGGVASTIAQLRGFFANIEVPILTVPAVLTGVDVEINVPATGSVGNTLKGYHVELEVYGSVVSDVKGYHSNILAGIGSAISGDVYGAHSYIDNIDTVPNVYGRYLDIQNNATVTNNIYGDYIDVTPDSTVDTVMGSFINVDCTSPATTLAVGLKVAATATDYGVDIAAVDVTGFGLRVTSTGTVAGGIQVTAKTNEFTGAVSTGGATTPSGSIGLATNAGFATEINDVAKSTISFGELTAVHGSVIRLTGNDACSIYNITGGVAGQWLIIINDGTATDVTFTEANNLIVTDVSNTATVGIQQSIFFVYDSTVSKWRQIQLSA